MASNTAGNSFWRMQKIFKLQQPTRSRESLPAPPEGMIWKQDENTQEWRLFSEASAAVEPELVTEARKSSAVAVSPETTERKTIVDRLPPRCGGGKVVDRLPIFRNTSDTNKSSVKSVKSSDDWEFLSDRISNNSSHHTPGVMVHRSSPTITSGSIRSITSMEGGGHSGRSTVSVPFKIQRTASSSTIDSQDAALGPLGKGVLGVDYVEHVVMPTDTLQGICLSYKVGSTKLRQANHFSGNSLLLAPKKLVIPLSKTALRSGFIRVQDTDAKEYKLHAFLAEFPDLSMTEAKGYLELADWVLANAVREAKDDGEWEQDIDNCSLRSGEIRITPKMNQGITVGFKTEGAGIQPPPQPHQKAVAALAKKDVPSIATKTVKAQDVYRAASQHDNFGFELQPIADKKENTPSP